MLAFNQYIVTQKDNESINFAIDVANSVLFQIAADNNCNKVVRYGHKKRTVKFYEGRKLILLVQIIRCTVIHEDQTEVVMFYGWHMVNQRIAYSNLLIT